MSSKKQDLTTAFARALPAPIILEHIKKTAFPLVTEDLDGNPLVVPGKPVALIGPPGTGKTAQIHALAQEQGYQVIVLQLSTLAPESMNGIPVVGEVEVWKDGEKKVHRVAEDLLTWWQLQALVAEGGKTLIFLDELSNADPAVVATTLTLVQDLRLPSNKVLPPETVIVAAMNAEEDSPNGSPMSAPMANRMAWFVWEADFTQWERGMRVAFGAPMSEREKFWRGMIADFLKKNPGFFYKRAEGDTGGVTPEEREVNRNAWPSPRTWDNLARTLIRYEQDEIVLVGQIAAATVGFAAAVEFQAFLGQQFKLLDPQEALRDPHLILRENIFKSVNSTKALARNMVNYAIQHPSDEAEKRGQHHNVKRLIDLVGLSVTRKDDGGESDFFPLRAEFMGLFPDLCVAVRGTGLMGALLKHQQFYKDLSDASLREGQLAVEAQQAQAA